MALIERLCHTDPDEGRNMAWTPFADALYLILDGKHTAAQVKGFYEMTAEDGTEFDSLVARINAASGTANKLLKIAEVHAILGIYEVGLPPNPYDTVDEVRTALLTNL